MSESEEEDGEYQKKFYGPGLTGLLRRRWAKLPRRVKVLLVRVLPLLVNYVQGVHTLLARRRAAVRQDRILPVMPMF